MMLKKFRKINPKYWLAGGAIIAAFGLGKKCEGNESQQKIQNLTNEFIQKSRDYEQKIADLDMSKKTFRFYHYNGDGIRLADLKHFNQEKFENTDSLELIKRRVPELTAAEIAKAAAFRGADGKFLADSLHLDEIRALKSDVKDSLRDFQTKGDTLGLINMCAKYREVSLLEMYLLSDKEKQHHLKYLEKSDEDLESICRVRPTIIKSKAKAGAYRSKGEFWRDWHRVMLADEILNYRSMRSFNNQLVNELTEAKSAEARRNYLEGRKARYRAMADSAVEQRRKEQLKIFMPETFWHKINGGQQYGN